MEMNLLFLFGWIFQWRRADWRRGWNLKIRYYSYIKSCDRIVFSSFKSLHQNPEKEAA
jgi:hypothetical protein